LPLYVGELGKGDILCRPRPAEKVTAERLIEGIRRGKDALKRVDHAAAIRWKFCGLTGIGIL
jgi:hypothetical protein